MTKLNLQGGTLGRLKQYIDLGLGSSGSWWAATTAQAGWRKLPNLCQKEVFTALICHPVFIQNQM